MQLVSARIWTRVTVSISYEDNHYTKGTSINGRVMLTRIMNIKYQYLKLFNSVPKLNYWYYIVLLGIIWLRTNK